MADEERWCSRSLCWYLSVEGILILIFLSRSLLKIKFDRILTLRKFSRILRFITEIEIVLKWIAGVKHCHVTFPGILLRISFTSVIRHFSERRRSKLLVVFHSHVILVLEATTRSLDIFSDSWSCVAVVFPGIYSVDGLLHWHQLLLHVSILSLLRSNVRPILRLRPVSSHELLSVALLNLSLLLQVLLLPILKEVCIVNFLSLFLSLLLLNEHLLC